MPETPGSVFEQADRDFDERSISPRFSLVLPVKEFKQSIVLQAAVGPHKRTTAAPFQHVFEK